MKGARLLGAFVTAFVVGGLMGVAEGAVRWMDGYPLTGLAIPPARTAAVDIVAGSSRDTADARHLSSVALAPDVDPQWYTHDPPPLPRHPMPQSLNARWERYAQSDPFGAFFAWNSRYLRKQLCAGASFGSLGILNDFYYFDPPTDTEYPSYRHLSHINPPGWFPTSRFGWRGPEVALNKPAGTIRIAFVGSSMTIDPYGLPFSHIEFIGEWLNLWARARGLSVRVEVINAARTGVGAPSVAESVLQELLPLEPDLVIFDGANDFGPGSMFALPAGLLPPVETGWEFEGYSAIARRLRSIRDRVQRGREPSKPAFPMQWPVDVDLMNPDIGHTPLPMGLEGVITRLEQMRTALASIGSTLAVTSQVGIVSDGLVLQLPRDQSIYNVLNVEHYPMSYKDIRTLLDFQNRVFRLYAEKHHLPFFDKAATYPADPELFLDLFHMSPAGLRLQSWLYLQMLAPWLETEVAAKRLPRAMAHPRDQHPAFPDAPYPLKSRAAILASCN